MKTCIRITLAAALAWSAGAAAGDEPGFGFGLPTLAELFGWAAETRFIDYPPQPVLPPPSIPPGVLPPPGTGPGEWWGSCQRVGEIWICHQN